MSDGFKLNRGFINSLAVKGIFSNYPELNFNIWDLGESVYATSSQEAVTRIPVAIGSVASLKFAVETTIELDLTGFAGVCDAWTKQIRDKCAALDGTFTLIDVVGKEIVLDGNISIHTTEPAVNLNTACSHFVIIGNSIVNREAAGLF